MSRILEPERSKSIVFSFGYFRNVKKLQKTSLLASNAKNALIALFGL
jgi:hypothetical protein